MRNPTAIPPAQAMPSRAVTNRVFFRRGCKENDLRREADWQQRVFHFVAEMSLPKKWHDFYSLLRFGLLRTAKKETLSDKLLKVVSGGQTGVDRGALDAALEWGFSCGGWCPAGRLAEDGIIPGHYPVVELPDAGYAERTARNVADSDATIIILNGEPIGGTGETIDCCVEMQKPHLVIDCGRKGIAEAIDAVTQFVKDLGFRPPAIVLNIAGPRASQWPQGHEIARQIVSGMLRRFSGQNDVNEYSS